MRRGDSTSATTAHNRVEWGSWSALVALTIIHLSGSLYSRKFPNHHR